MFNVKHRVRLRGLDQVVVVSGIPAGRLQRHGAPIVLR
jgi:hypothetical protein